MKKLQQNLVVAQNLLRTAICVVLYLMLCYPMLAQTTPKDSLPPTAKKPPFSSKNIRLNWESTRILEEAPYVFEGYLKSADHIQIGSDSFQWHYRIQVTKVYRGDIKIGEVEIVGKRPQRTLLGYVKKQPYESFIYFCYSYPNPKEPKLLHLNNRRLLGLNRIDQMQAIIEVDYSDKIDDYSGFRGGISNATNAEFIALFKYYGLIKEEEQKKKAVGGVKKSVQIHQGNKKVLNPTDIGLYIAVADEYISPSNGDLWYEFDLTVKADAPDTYLDNLGIAFGFNAAALGFSVAANNAVAVSLMDNFDNPTYTVSPITDELGGTAVLLNIQTTNPVEWQRVKIPTTQPIQLAHLRFKIIDCQENLGGNFIILPNQLPATYLTDAAAPAAMAIPYDLADFSQPTFLRTASPTNYCDATNIQFFPATIKAGNMELLTITRTGGGATGGFGNQKGKIVFKNADADGGKCDPITASTIYKIDNYKDTTFVIQSWTNDTIRLYLPSQIGTKVPGTDKIAILKKDGSSVGKTSEKLYITAAYKNSLGRANYLVNRNCQTTYTVGISQNLSNPDTVSSYFGAGITPAILRATIDSSIRAWNTKLGYAALSLRGAYVQPNENTANISVVRVTYTISDGAVMITNTGSLTTGKVNNKETNAILKFDISIYKRQLSEGNEHKIGWHFGLYNDNTGTIESGGRTYYKFDFYHAFLHELGHGLGLDHAIGFDREDGDIMFASGHTNEVASQRINLTSANQDGSIAGAISLINTARNLIWTSFVSPTTPIGTLGAATTPNSNYTLNATSTTATTITLCANGGANDYKDIIVQPSATTTDNLVYFWQKKGVTAGSTWSYSLPTCKKVIANKLSLTASCVQTGDMFRVEASLNGCKLTTPSNTITANVIQPLDASSVLFEPIPALCGTNAYTLNATPQGNFNIENCAHCIDKTALIPTLVPAAILATAPTATSVTKTVKYTVADPCGSATTTPPFTIERTQEVTVYRDCAAPASILNINLLYKNEYSPLPVADIWNYFTGTNNTLSLKLNFTALGTATAANVKLQISNDGGVFPTNFTDNILGSISPASPNIIDFTLNQTAHSGTRKFRIFVGSTIKESATYKFCSSTNTACRKINRREIQDSTHSPIAIYPNPADDQLLIEYPQFTADSYQITVMDIQGRIIATQQSQESITTLSTTQWANGLYIVRIDDGQHIITQKIVVQH